MKQISAFLMILLAGSSASASGKESSDQTALHVLIIPKFETRDMSSVFPGEAQLQQAGILLPISR